MLAKRYTFLLVVISIITGMNEHTVNENYINQSRAVFAYILNSVDKAYYQKAGSDNTEIRNSQDEGRKLLLYKYVTDYIQSSNFINHAGYGLILVFGVVLLMFFENNSTCKNMIWRAYTF